MKNIPEIFGSMVFNDGVMQTKLPKETYETLKKTITLGTHLEREVAHIVANAIKEWAVENGATHYTHWFQPMTGITAGKHDSFIAPGGDGKVIMDFSGKELVRGESDASSFPSGGLRATFEARGYTVWDTTSPAFIKNDTLYIPTAYCSYGGEALDKKTPLLRSMQAVEIQAKRVLKLLGTEEVSRVTAMAGVEQEYFLIDKELYKKRPDLVFTGRTLFGAPPPKGQELDDHYFGSIKPRAADFMREVDEELWKLGVYAKTRHNEVAPSQHEIALIYTTANIAADHNQITMELMKSIADKHGLACILHEKPFAGVNGSGKHINFSLQTDAGINLFEPGETPFENAQFLLFLLAVVKAADEYQDLLRVSAASASNDLRLGTDEAPPAVISVFLGDDLTEILEAIECNSEYDSKDKTQMEIGVTVLPHFFKDSADRNRTSPFAFTGNKFEFRMVGSAFSVSGACFIINTAVAEALCEFADKLEKSPDINAGLTALIKESFSKHKRIIYNGNNYSSEWLAEAEKRGLSNLKTTADALPALISPQSVGLFSKHGVLSGTELNSRYEILIRNYCKTIRIEMLTLLELTKKHIIPPCIAYQDRLAGLLTKKKELAGYDFSLEDSLLGKISELSAELICKLRILENSAEKYIELNETKECACYCRDNVIPSMNSLRISIDELESIIPCEYRTLPAYAELLYSI